MRHSTCAIFTPSSGVGGDVRCRQSHASIQTQRVGYRAGLPAEHVHQDVGVQRCVPALQVFHFAPWDPQRQRVQTAQE